MWLMTKHGFYSIVLKGETYHVRSRERQDLENLVKLVPLPDAAIHESLQADYRFRILVNSSQLLSILNCLGQSLDYPNFKGEIDERPDQARKPYHEVWSVLAVALGAYGRPGMAQHMWNR